MCSRFLNGIFLALILSVSPYVFGQDDEGQQLTLNYYIEVAKAGEPYAQLALGEVYFQGEFTERDYIQAYAWLYVAEQQGADEGHQHMLDAWEAMPENKRVQARVLAEEFLKAYTLQE